MTTYSYSHLRDWLACPAKRRLRDAGATPQGDSTLAEIGKLVHDAIRRYTEHCHAAGVGTDVPEMDRCVVYVADGHTNSYRYPSWLPDARTLCDRFAATHVIEHEHIGGIEERLAMNRHGSPVPFDSPDAYFRGILDLITFPAVQSAAITDYKTGWNPEPDKLQADCYAWLVLSLFPNVEHVTVTFDLLRFGTQQAYSYARDEYSALDGRLRELIAAVEADTERRPVPGWACRTCDYAHACNAVTIPVDAVSSETGARVAVEYISRTERALSDVKSALREWCKQHGPVAHNGVVWGYHTTERPVWPELSVFRAGCYAAGIDPDDYLRVDGTQAKRLMRHDALRDCAMTERATRFEGRKR